MKSVLTILFFLCFSLLKSQTIFDTKYQKLLHLEEDSSVSINEIYEDESKGLIETFIIEVKDKNQKQLVKDFKNWYSKYFISLKTTLQSETEDQLVFNYIHTSFFKQGLFQINSPNDHHLRLVVQFKDYKIRVQFIDDLSFVSYGEKYIIVNSSNKYYIKGIKYQLYLNELKHMSEILTDINNSITKPSTDNW
jgi:hypothetical protein